MSIFLDTFRFLSQSTHNSYVLTNCLADTEEDKQLYEQVEKMVQEQGSFFIPVQLEISKEEYLKRLTRP